MMGRQTGDQSQLFYLFNLEARIPERHLLRRISPIVTRVLTDLRSRLEPSYSRRGRPLGGPPCPDLTDLFHPLRGQPGLHMRVADLKLRNGFFDRLVGFRRLRYRGSWVTALSTTTAQGRAAAA